MQRTFFSYTNTTLKHLQDLFFALLEITPDCFPRQCNDWALMMDRTGLEPVTACL